MALVDFWDSAAKQKNSIRLKGAHQGRAAQLLGMHGGHPVGTLGERRLGFSSVPPDLSVAPSC
ncbi:hypothetical protein ACLQ2D_10780 [Streptomyces sp. DT199]|uniref:hypothetical protein n=1 Tax=Streptomyces TaxID=1883 RepID=UPI0033A335CB